MPKTEHSSEVRMSWTDCIRGEWRTHLGAGKPIILSKASHEDVFISVNIVRDKGNDGDLLLQVRLKSNINFCQEFRVISPNAPIIINKELESELVRPTAIQGLSPSINRYGAYGETLFTSFYSIREQVVHEDSNGIKIENPNANAGSGNLIEISPGGMTITLLDAPLRIGNSSGTADTKNVLHWKNLLAPFFIADSSGSYYVEPCRKTKQIIETEPEWLDIDWKRYLIDRRNIMPPLAPIIPKPGPNPTPPYIDNDFQTPLVNPGRLDKDGNPLPIEKDWLLNPMTVVQYGDVQIGASGIKPIAEMVTTQKEKLI
jgi:hypothetical protein